MLSDFLALTIQERLAGVSLTHPVIIAAVVLALLWTIWRTWKFSFFPSMYPLYPMEYPYLLPVIGHLHSFFKDSSALMSRARMYFNDAREPFAITAANNTFYVLTKPDDVAAAYRNTKTFSFDAVLQDLMQKIGVSELGIQKMFSSPDSSKQVFPNPFNKCLARLSRELHIHQLYPGEGNLLNAIDEEFVRYFDQYLELDSLARRTRYVTSPHKTAVDLSLRTWTSDFFANAGQDAYFGKRLRQIDPDMTWTFMEFDALFWQVLFQYPKVLSKKMNAALDKMIASMKQYFAVPVSERTDTVWFTQALEEEMRLLDTPSNDIAAMMVTIYMINTNTGKAAFWMLSYMLFEPELLDIVREETKPAFTNGKIDAKYIADSCPRLKGIWDETIRLTAFSASVRTIIDDTPVGGKILRKGNKLMIPYRELHFDENVFGKGVTEFQSERFIKEPGLTRHPSWRPFGGGNTQCPGRFAARQSAAVFVAMALHRYDIEMCPGNQAFPQPEEGNPSLGIMDTKEGSDLRLRLTKRT